MKEMDTPDHMTNLRLPTPSNCAAKLYFTVERKKEIKRATVPFPFIQ